MGQALEEKDKFEDLKSEALMGHIQTGRNGSLMQKRYKTREKDLGLSLGQDNRTQKSYSSPNPPSVTSCHSARLGHWWPQERRRTPTSCI